MFHDFVLEKNKIEEYVENEIGGYCSLNNSCSALIAHINRKRENVVDNENNNDNNKDISIDILIGKLSVLHSYLLHPKDQLYRKKNKNNNNNKRFETNIKKK